MSFNLLKMKKRFSKAYNIIGFIVLFINLSKPQFSLDSINDLIDPTDYYT